MGYFWTIVTLVIALGLTWRYLGSYMAAVFEGGCTSWGGPSVPIYRLLGTSPEQEQTWKRYAGSMVIFSAISIGDHLPDHPHPGIAAAQSPAPRCRCTRRSASTPPPRS